MHIPDPDLPSNRPVAIKAAAGLLIVHGAYFLIHSLLVLQSLESLVYDLLYFSIMALFAWSFWSRKTIGVNIYLTLLILGVVFVLLSSGVLAVISYILTVPSAISMAVGVALLLPSSRRWLYS
jgi:hypothetical protein